MRYYGSASVFPHVQGGFREAIDVHPSQCVPLPDGMAYELAVFAEPLSVTLQAVNRAGPVFGRSVLGHRLRPDRCPDGGDPEGRRCRLDHRDRPARGAARQGRGRRRRRDHRRRPATRQRSTATAPGAAGSTSRSRPRAASPASRPASTACGPAASWSSSATSRAAPGPWSLQALMTKELDLTGLVPLQPRVRAGPAGARGPADRRRASAYRPLPAGGGEARRSSSPSTAAGR